MITDNRFLIQNTEDFYTTTNTNAFLETPIVYNLYHKGAMNIIWLYHYKFDIMLLYLR